MTRSLTMERLGFALVLAFLLVGLLTPVHAQSTYTLWLSTWPTSGHGLPPEDSIRRIPVRGIPDEKLCNSIGQATQDAYPAYEDRMHLTREMLGFQCEGRP